MTLPQLEALEERRMIAVRHARFNAGLIASTIYNAHRGGDSDPIEVWDFLPGYERDPEEIEQEKLQRSTRQGVLVAFSRMQGKTVEQVRVEAVKMVARMTESGVTDAEYMVREAFQEVIQQPFEV